MKVIAIFITLLYVTKPVIIEPVQLAKRLNVMYYLPMKKGFYDYEIKLIKALKPLYNYQHK